MIREYDMEQNFIVYFFGEDTNSIRNVLLCRSFSNNKYDGTVAKCDL